MKTARLNFRSIAPILGGLALLFALAVSASGQCNPGRVFDPTNLSLGAALGGGTCPGGNCQAPMPPAAQPLSSAASASSAAGMQQPNMDQIVAAVVRAMQTQGMTNAYAAQAYKPLYFGQGGGAASASAVAGGADYYAPAPTVVSLQTPAVSLGINTLAVPTIPVALAGTSSASSASSVAGGGGCGGGGRGFFFRRGRARTRSVSQVNGNRSVSVSVSR